MSDRYWYDSFPGLDLDKPRVVLDFYRTPYGGPENLLHVLGVLGFGLDACGDRDAPYTTVSQNRGGVA